MYRLDESLKGNMYDLVVNLYTPNFAIKYIQSITSNLPCLPSSIVPSYCS